MSRLATSHDPAGIGTFIVQHRSYQAFGWDLALRAQIQFARVLNRDDRMGGLGSWMKDPDSVGDWNGAQLWKKEKRQIPMWRNATPAVTWSKDVPTAGSNVCAVLSTDKAEHLPVWTKSWDADTRLKSAKSTRPETWPKFPFGTYGISLAADREDEQEDLFFPCDPNLRAVNRMGDFDMGTRVYDMGAGFAIEKDRFGRLQSQTWVVKKPKG